MAAHLRTGNPLKSGEITGFEPRTAVAQSGVATNEQPQLPNEQPQLPTEQPQLPIYFHTYLFVYLYILLLY